MKKRNLIAATAMASILSLAIAGAQADEHAADAAKAETEKCYGVAKAGHNDCAGPGHSCAGHAATDGDAAEWVMVPAGLCDKLVGGSTTKPEGEAK